MDVDFRMLIARFIFAEHRQIRMGSGQQLNLTKPLLKFRPLLKGISFLRQPTIVQAPPSRIRGYKAAVHHR